PRLRRRRRPTTRSAPSSPMSAASPCPTPDWTSWRASRRQTRSCPPNSSSSTSPAWWRAPPRAKGSVTSSSAISARAMPSPTYSAADEAAAKKRGMPAVVSSAAIQAEVAQLPADEQAEFLGHLGLKETGLDRVVHAGYQLLHLVTFFTVGPKEARAWTVRREARAPEAAGVIHTDFEKGFIRAETIAYDDYVTLNGEAGARDAGKLRLEGKDYAVKDGDVFHFRFNV